MLPTKFHQNESTPQVQNNSDPTRATFTGLSQKLVSDLTGNSYFQKSILSEILNLRQLYAYGAELAIRQISYLPWSSHLEKIVILTIYFSKIRYQISPPNSHQSLHFALLIPMLYSKLYWKDYMNFLKKRKILPTCPAGIEFRISGLWRQTSYRLRHLD